MTDWEIQRAEPGDWERVRAVRLRSLQDAPDAFGTTLAEDEARPLDEWRTRLESPRAATHLLVVDGRDEGMVVSLAIGQEGLTALAAMWVAPEARGRGLGGALVDTATAWARAGGHDRMLLEVADTGGPAVGLYERKGFVPNGTTGTLPPPREHISTHQRMLTL